MRLPSEIVDSLESVSVIKDLLTATKGPISVSYPDVVNRSAERFIRAFDGVDIEYRILAAHKATDSSALLRSLKNKTGIDVASIQEFNHALSLGFMPGDIIATGPKSRYFLAELANYPDSTIVIDSEHELEYLTSIDARNPILIRITRSLLGRSTQSTTSRFGVDNNGFERAKEILAITAERLIGLAFHIDTQSTEEKARAVYVLSEMLMQLQSGGFDNATILDIGGGFGQKLGMTATDINTFKQKHDTNHVSLPALPVEDDRVHSLFAVPFDGQTLGRHLQERLIELWCEPGAALFNTCGIVVAEVIDVRELDGRVMVVCDIHRNQMTFEDFDSPLDPLLLPCSDAATVSVECDIYGHLCTESDRLYRRPITFTDRPSIGDILVFPATGAYSSHFNASRAIGHPLAKKYVYQDGQFGEDIV